MAEVPCRTSVLSQSGFWNDLKKKEIEKIEEDRRKKRLERLKATADGYLEEVEGLLAYETRADIAEEKLKLQQLLKLVMPKANNKINDFSGQESASTSSITIDPKIQEDFSVSRQFPMKRKLSTTIRKNDSENAKRIRPRDTTNSNIDVLPPLSSHFSAVHKNHQSKVNEDANEMVGNGAGSNIKPALQSEPDTFPILAKSHARAFTNEQFNHSRRVSFGRNLTLADLSSREDSPSKSNNNINPPRTSLAIDSSISLLGASLPSSTASSSFIYQSDSSRSVSKFYSWDYLDGPGRIDSNVETPWVYNEIAVGAALMRFRRKVVENNGGYTEAHEKLAVNFIFLIEEDYRTDSLQGEVGDRIWDVLCDAVREIVPRFPDSVVTEAHDWAHKLEENKMWEFEKIEESPPKDQQLKAILRNITNNTKFWNTQRDNEDTFLKDRLGPFLDVYFGKLRYVNSHWTPTQDDTRDQEMSTLVPDYGASTIIGGRRRMQWIPHPPDHGSCEYAKKIIEQTISRIRSVKDEESMGSKVPMSWLRPSFRKPKRFQV
ncbi:hypothetical protein FBU30_004904 [Linnemannia zychae]|nr:hypothetical protein FBU30_004904 [Linnemannia zychae]